jgi:hypothetical protein
VFEQAEWKQKTHDVELEENEEEEGGKSRRRRNEVEQSGGRKGGWTVGGARMYVTSW